MKVRSTKVDAGDFKHELLNRLRSTMAVNVLTCVVYYVIGERKQQTFNTEQNFTQREVQSVVL